MKLATLDADQQEIMVVHASGDVEMVTRAQLILCDEEIYRRGNTGTKVM